MTPTTTRTPHDPGAGPGGLYDVARLAERLGIATGTLRQHVAAQVPWLPVPEKVGGVHVWTAEALIGIEDRRRAPGRPRRTTEAASTAASPTVTELVPEALGEPVDGEPADGWWDAPGE